MPKATRALSLSEIARIWAHRVFNTKNPAAVRSFKSTSRESHPSQMRFNLQELVKILPDGPIPAHVLEITSQLEVSPLHMPSSWMKSAIAVEKYGLIGHLVKQASSPEVRSIIIPQVVSFIRRQDDPTSEHIDLAKMVVVNSVNDLIPHIRAVELPKNLRPSSKSGEVGGFISMVRIGNALDEVVSAISPQAWSAFCSSVINGQHSMENYYLGILKKEMEWLETHHKRQMLSKIASSNQPDTSPRSPRLHRPSM